MSEQSYATASQCLAMPKLYISVPMLCHSTGLLFNAETKRTLALPKRGQSMLCPCSAFLRFALTSTLLSQNHAPLSHRLNVLYSAHALKLTAVAIHRYSVPLHR